MRILIIEDDAIQALVLEMSLRKTGRYVVKKAASAGEGLALIAGFNPHLLLVDVHLEGEMSGIDLIKKAREISNIKVIYITGNSDRKYRVKAEETGFLAYLTKPVHPQKLLGILDAESLL